MRIGLIGAGGTGKTEAAKLLAEREKLTLWQSVMRTQMQERQILDEASLLVKTPAEVWEFQKECFLKKLHQDQTAPEGVFERTLLDHYAYCLNYCSGEMDDGTTEAFLSLVGINLRKYDLLVFFPIEHVTWDRTDAIRRRERAWAYLNDATMRGLIHRLYLPTRRVPKASVEGRVAWMSDQLRELRGG